jgi:hypothetical protein
MPDIHVAWWNLENLFDHENASRDPQLQSQLGSDLRGWTAALRDRKIDQLASVVVQMFGGAGPDLLGVCEIENEGVGARLASRLVVGNRDYRVLHHESPDARGIDVSFLFDHNVLRADPAQADHQVVHRRTGTRDIFWGDFRVIATDATFVAVGNHWPARAGSGKYASEPYRMLTGETLSYRIARLFEAFDVGTRLPALVMGDFNDEPFDRSMREYLLGTRDRGRVTRARSPRLLNLMWPLLSQANPGSYKYGSDWNMLDQFLVTRGMLRTDSAVTVRADTAAIFRPPEMVGGGGAPLRFGLPGKRNLNRDGYSDHFPVTLVLHAHE